MADGIRPSSCLSAPRSNHVAVALVITTEASSSPGVHNSWLAPRKAVPSACRGAHVDGMAFQIGQRRRQAIRSEKDE
jgi:hypothetical protein